eukprot:2683608-Pyramimonas_sp.AAC.1
MKVEPSKDSPPHTPPGGKKRKLSSKTSADGHHGIAANTSAKKDDPADEIATDAESKREAATATPSAAS